MNKTEILLVVTTASTTVCLSAAVRGFVREVKKIMREGRPVVEETPEVVVAEVPVRYEGLEKPYPPGFLDYKTGRYVNIDPRTGKEYFVS